MGIVQGHVAAPNEQTLAASGGADTLRCAECNELVAADRIRYREERAKVVPRGRWRSGGAPIFAPTARQAKAFGAYRIERAPVCLDCIRRQRLALASVCGVAMACLTMAVLVYSHGESTTDPTRFQPQQRHEAAFAVIAPPGPPSRLTASPLAPAPATTAPGAVRLAVPPAAVPPPPFAPPKAGATNAPAAPDESAGGIHVEAVGPAAQHPVELEKRRASSRKRLARIPVLRAVPAPRTLALPTRSHIICGGGIQCERRLETGYSTAQR